MLTKEKVLDQITADEHGNLMYREVTRIMEDGKELSKSYHRSSLSPGASLDNIDPKVCLMAQATWTPETIAPFTAGVVTKIEEQATAKAAFEAECIACELAKTASEAAKVDADAAKAACDIACAAASAAAQAVIVSKDAEIAALKAKAAAEELTALEKA